MLALVALTGLFVAWLLVWHAPARWRLGLWALVIGAAVVPWSSLQLHSHWERLQWVPFASPPEFSLTDVVVNLALYLPLGVFAALGPSRAWSLTRVALAAGGLSAVTELSQVYSHGRFPTSGDLLLNVAGAVAGAWLARRWRARSG